MRRARIRTLAIIGLGGALSGSVMFLVGAFAGARLTVDATGVHLAALGNLALFIVGLGLALAAGIVAAIAWIGALIRVATLREWGWFVCIVLTRSLGTLIWSLVGPDVPTSILQGPSFQHDPADPSP